MWNNLLRKLWNIAPSSQCEMKFASPHLRSKYFTAKLFHMAKPYFTRRRRISLKKALAFASAFFWLPIANCAKHILRGTLNGRLLWNQNGRKRPYLSKFQPYGQKRCVLIIPDIGSNQKERQNKKQVERPASCFGVTGQNYNSAF